MTILTEENTVDYNGDGVTTAFVYPYKFILHSDLLVVITDTATNVVSEKVIDADYSVTGGQGEAGEVTMFVAPAVGERLTILNNPPKDQPTTFKDLSKFPSRLIELVFDRTVLQLQTFTETLNRTFRLPIGSTASAELPQYEAGAYFGWSSTEEEIENKEPPVVSEELLTFGAGLNKVGSEVSVGLASTDPGLEFTSGNLRVKADDVTLERRSQGIGAKTAEQAATISSSTITALQRNIAVSTEGGAPTDDLTTIDLTALPDGMPFQIRPAASGQTIVVREGLGNIFMADGQDVALNSPRFALSLQKRGTEAYETGRAFRPPALLTAVANSGQITLTASSEANFSHLLGVRPEIVDATLVCIAEDLGYVPGEELLVERNSNHDSGTNAGWMLRVNASTITVFFGPSVGLPFLRKDKTAWQVINPANWRLVLRAFA